MSEKLKYMFDRNFDDPFYDDSPTETADFTSISVDGIPSISQLLNSLNSKTAVDISEDNFAKKEESDLDLSIGEPPEKPEEPEEQEVVVEEPAEPVAPVVVGIPQEEVDKMIEHARQETREAVEKEVSESAYKKGFDAGIEEGKSLGQSQAWSDALDTIQQKTNDLLEILNGQLVQLAPVAEKMAKDCFDSTMEMALAVVKKIYPSMKAEASEEIRKLLEENFHFLAKEPKIIIKIHPEMVDPIKEKLAEVAKKNSFSGHISINKDESLPKTDCRVEWEYGGLDRSVQSILDETEELLKTYKQGK